jgi:uncharacterized protein YndB with AHSA1/START domain
MRGIVVALSRFFNTSLNERCSMSAMNTPLNNTLVVSESVVIHATPAKVWAALTTPALIKAYLFGTETSTDWKVGNPITFRGVYGPENHSYCDKGVILENIPNKTLRYSYWSSFSGLEDRPENYATVTYSLEQQDGQTRFTWTQRGYPNEERCEHSKSGMKDLLAQIKEIAERKSAD